MILSVTLNPCVHHILAYRGGMEDGVVRRPVRSFFQPGGKGLNASRVAVTLGARVTALTPCGGVEGRLFLREVRLSGVRVEPVWISRPTRFSTCLYDMERGSFLELLEPGVELSEREVEALFERYEDLLPRADRVALSGSSTASLTLLITHGKFAPSDPSSGFFTSIISAPPSAAIRASSTLIGLTSNFMFTYLL